MDAGECSAMDTYVVSWLLTLVTSSMFELEKKPVGNNRPEVIISHDIFIAEDYHYLRSANIMML